jgi:uncharacterized lipoprotein YmbA
MKSMMVVAFLGLTGCVSIPREHVLSCDDQEVGIGIDRAWKDGDTWQMVHVPDYWGKRAKTQYVQKPGQHCQVYVDTAKDY